VSDVVKVRGALDQVGSTFFLRVPSTLLDSVYTARPVRIRSSSGRCSARILRRESGEVVLMLPRRTLEALGVAPDAREVEFSIDVPREKLRLDPPEDLALALREGGLRWDAMPERERHQAVVLVQEAKTPELRQARIAAIVSAVKDHQ
jgi:hypothetical protein